MVLGGHASNVLRNLSNGGDAGALTIGSGITMHGKNGTIGSSFYPLINQGTIADDVAGGTIDVYGAPLMNQGTLKADGGTLGVHFGTGGTSTGTLAAVNGGTLSTADTWTLDGTTTAGAGATVNLGGTVQLDTGYSLDTAAGTLNLTDTLDLAGGTVHTLTLDAASGSLNLRSGTIQGGTVSGSDGAQLVAAFGSNYLRQGVTLDADLDMTTVTSNRVYVYDGLTLNGTISIGSTDGARYGDLWFYGTQTLGGNGDGGPRRPCQQPAPEPVERRRRDIDDRLRHHRPRRSGRGRQQRLPSDQPGNDHR